MRARFTRVLLDEISSYLSFSVLTFKIERVIVSLDPDSRVWTLSLNGEVSCVAANASLREASVHVSGGKQI